MTEQEQKEMQERYRERQGKERAEAVNRAAEFVPVVAELAAALGKGWIAEYEIFDYGNLQGVTDVQRFRLLKDGKRRIYASKRYGSPMYDFSGVYPSAEDGYTFNQRDDPSAGCNFERGGKRIAVDLKLRLLPDMDRLYAERYKKVREYEQAKDRHTAFVQSLELALDTQAHALTSRAEMRRVSGNAGRLYYGFVTTQNTQDAKIEISGCSQELALEIARLINAERLRIEAMVAESMKG